MRVVFCCKSSAGLSELVEPRSVWAVVNLSAERVAALREQLKLADQIGQLDPTFREMQFKTNEVQVYYYIPELDDRGFENEFNEVYDWGWAVLPDDLDLEYEPLELMSERFCVRPAKGKRPATFQWLIHTHDEMGPGRTIKCSLADLEEVLSEAGVAA